MKDKSVYLVIFSYLLLSIFGIQFIIWIGGGSNSLISEQRHDNVVNLKLSTSWNLTGNPITISGNGDWAVKAAFYDWVSGSGTWGDPYIIENVTIDGENSGSCISIGGSDVPFIVRNCTLSNSGQYGAGILLGNVENGHILNNTCSDSIRNGIEIEDCYNITISDNIINNNHIYGILVLSSNETNIFGNKVSLNAEGIYLLESNYSILAGNVIDDHIFDGIYFLRCKFNNISSNTITRAARHGIRIHYSEEINIIMNTAENNTSHGIHYFHAHNSTIKNNTLSYNRIGIGVFESNYNLFTGNFIYDNDDGCFTLDEISVGNVYEYNYCGTNQNPDPPPVPPPSNIIPSFNVVLLVISLLFSITLLLFKRFNIRKQSIQKP